MIAQFELSPNQGSDEARGNYRFYAWSNGGTASLAGLTQRHSGFGVSADQKLGENWTVFGRWGQRTSGDGQFDRGLTLGLEVAGKAWGRGNDNLGLAYGVLRTSEAWRVATLGKALTGYEASGQERIAEIYYRFKLGQHLDLSPDLQWVQRPGGDPAAGTVRVLGLRATVTF